MADQNGASVGEFVARPEAPARRRRKGSDFPYDQVMATFEQPGSAYRFTVANRKPNRVLASMKSEFKRRGFKMVGLVEDDGSIQAWIQKAITPGESKPRKRKAKAEAA